MASELKSYQSQVNAYQFEIERLDREIGNCKQLYFERKRQEKMAQMMGMGQNEIIPEVDDEMGGGQEYPNDGYQQYY